MGAAGLDQAAASAGALLLQAGRALANGAALDLDHGAAGVGLSGAPVGVAGATGRPRRA